MFSVANFLPMAAIANSLLPMATSVVASRMIFRSLVRDFVPPEVQNFISSRIRKLINNLTSKLTIVIDESDDLTTNEIYQAVEIYLRNKVSPTNGQTMRISKSVKEKNIKIVPGKNEEIVDAFNGIQFKWRSTSRQMESKIPHNMRDFTSTYRSEVRSFEFDFHKKHKDMVFDSYLPHILNQLKAMKEENKPLKIFTLKSERMYHNNLADIWSSVNFDHPATFETLAMDVELKRTLMEDLDRFIQRREFYRRVGKAWKRGYLLHGPPGTGKSSLIAAIANYLKFDIYDLELTDLYGNHDLRRLLLSTANRSILVVEDIDCAIELQDRRANARAAAQPNRFSEGNGQQQVTLSGLLNFADGLWSSVGDERIIVFTTNHKDRLDPALLRPGRIDVHIHMTFCTPSGFRFLASNYLQIQEHALFQEIEELIEKVKVTPATIAEELMMSENPKVALEGVLKLLRNKRELGDEVNTEEPKTLGAQDQHDDKEDFN